MIPITILQSNVRINAFIFENGRLNNAKPHGRGGDFNFTYQCIYKNGQIEIKEVDSGTNNYNYYGDKQCNPYIPKKTSSKFKYKQVGKSAHKNYLEKINGYVEKWII